ncbi:MAG: hypothetical protein PHY31_07435 [Smithellaceae bacterium]|nr:hypothetical protein [Smithellaceae bacterium]
MSAKKTNILIRKSGFILAGLMLLALSFPGHAFAHAPKNVTLRYDAPTQTLMVTITHPSFLTHFHYIKRVQVKVNGGALQTFVYDGQPDVPTFTYSYRMVLAPGDNIEAQAFCSLFGNKTATLAVSVASR